MLEVKIKKLHKDVVIPKYETVGSAGMDLTAVSKEYDIHGNVVFGTGLAIQIPEGYYADLRPRSSISKYDLVLANSVGTIDADYRGEIGVILVNLSSQDFTINDGDRIAQMVIAKHETAIWEEVENLDETNRGEGGFGSSGVSK